jgi:hypothetical protein
MEQIDSVIYGVIEINGRRWGSCNLAVITTAQTSGSSANSTHRKRLIL